MFSFEAGRRCDSGPGTFTFETKQGNEIFTLVDQAIHSQKALAEEHRLSSPVNFDPDCPASLQHIRNAISNSMTSGSGDSSSCSSREADGDSGGSKPGSADGVLGKREGGDGGRVQGGGTGLKGRSLPEPPLMMGVLGGGGTPPRSPKGHAVKGVCLADENASLYSEPADSVRLLPPSADCLYSDPVDSIKGQNQTSNTNTPPVPTPRQRPVGDDAVGAAAQGAQGDHHPSGGNNRKPPDLYSHVYDQISMELNQKASALNLNGGVGRGRGGGRAANNNRRPPGGHAEGASSPPASSHEHIYDEPEGCAKGSVPASSLLPIYDEAHVESPSQRRQEEAAHPSGQEGNYSTPSQGKQPQRQSPPQFGQGHGMPQPPAPRFPKPTTAPKPGRGPFARKEPVPLPPGKHGGPSNNVNNNNNIWYGGGGGGAKVVYSRVSKAKPPATSAWYNQHHQAQLRSPDMIYDNLGDV